MAVLLGVAGMVVLWRFEPTRYALFPKCPLRATTGFHCPGCGTTRALHSLLNGHPLQAARFNPLLIFGLPVMLALLLWKRRREQATGLTVAPRLPWVLMVVVLVYFVARNVPSPSRSWLAPPATISEESLSENSQSGPSGLVGAMKRQH
jgi:hypothetical protein